MSNFSERKPGDPSQGEGAAATRALTAAPAPGTAVTSWKRSPRIRPEILNARPTPANLMAAYRRRFWLATILGLLTTAGVVALLWFIVPAKYEAYAQLLVSQQPPVVIHLTETPTDFETYKRTQQNLMKSRQVMETALQEFGAGKNPLMKGVVDKVAWLSNQLNVEYPFNSEIMRISIKAEQPQYLESLVNAVFDAYFKEVVNQELTDKRKRRDEMEKRYIAYQDDIRTKLSDIHILADKLGTSETSQARLRQTLALKTLDQLGQTRDDLQRQIAADELEIELFKIREKRLNEEPDEVLTSDIDKDPRVVEKQLSLQLVEKELSQLESATVHAKTNPSFIRKSQERATLLDKIDELRKTVKDELIRKMRVNGTSDGRQGKSLEELTTVDVRLKERYDKTKTDYAAQLALVQSMEVFSADLETRTSELRQLQLTAADLGTQLEHLNLEVNAPPRIKPLERATTPTDRDLKFKIIGIAFAGLVCLGLVVLGVSRLEFESRRMSHGTEVTHELGLRHLGAVPSITGLRVGRMFAKGNLEDQISESIDSIRAGLMHQAKVLSATPVVMVTSAMEQEGKSTVASRLAVSLANAGRRTLLIDGNLRDPGVHLTFNIPNEPGLCDLLRDRTQPSPGVIHDSEIPNLSILPAGDCDEVSLLDLARGDLKSIMDHLRKAYQFIVIDGSPVLTISDSLTFAEQANMALLSVRRDVSRIPNVYDACERLKTVGVEVLGVVVNGEE
jgi:capsular exopolysaccharide synthesis family protein